LAQSARRRVFVRIGLHRTFARSLLAPAFANFGLRGRGGGRHGSVLGLALRVEVADRDIGAEMHGVASSHLGSCFVAGRRDVSARMLPGRLGGDGGFGRAISCGRALRRDVVRVPQEHRDFFVAIERIFDRRLRWPAARCACCLFGSATGLILSPVGFDSFTLCWRWRWSWRLGACRRGSA
jgi:hypothetical protein